MIILNYDLHSRDKFIGGETPKIGSNDIYRAELGISGHH